MRQQVLISLISISAFLTTALAILPHSSYAWGLALLVVITLATVPVWALRPHVPSGTWVLVLAIGLMGLAWLHGSDGSKGVSVWNKPSRYFLTLPCLLCLLYYPPRRESILAGIACGAAVGGLYALYVTAVAGQARPWTEVGKSSNAIQLGNLCGLFGVICWVQLAVYWRRWRWNLKIMVLICVALGLAGSLLSESRGGWLALFLCLLVLFGLIVLHGCWRDAAISVAVLLGVLISAGWWQSDSVMHRIELAIQEVKAYEINNISNTSVGQRLEHWRVAWDMGLEKPIMGWGVVGYRSEKKRRVAVGLADKEVLKYSHAHNEVLDLFAKRGIVGVLALFILYGVPLALFWPGRKSHHPTGKYGEDELCLRLVGVSVPIAFAGFGLTQVFFAHYNGVILYLALVIFIFAALNGRTTETTAAVV